MCHKSILAQPVFDRLSSFLCHFIYLIPNFKDLYNVRNNKKLTVITAIKKCTL